MTARTTEAEIAEALARTEPTEADLADMRPGMAGATDEELVYSGQVGGIRSLVGQLRRSLARDNRDEAECIARLLGALLAVGDERRAEIAQARAAQRAQRATETTEVSA